MNRFSELDAIDSVNFDMYVCIYHICIALISCSMHVHKRFNNIVSKNCEEKGASLVGS